jgi:CDP-diacylglycerol--glycerol-3-phosphate 3-phosphatidyltransferase
MKHELHVITALGCGLLLLGFGLLGFTKTWMDAAQWLLQAGLLWGTICLYSGSRLELNRAHELAPLYNDLGWGNRLTILRGGLIALTGGFLFLDFNVLLPAILYTLAALLDRLDGFVARRSQQVSLLGNELDISFDALGLVVAPLLAISLGKLHGSYLLLSLAYYLYQLALQHRLRLALPVYALPQNPLRRTLAGFQMGFIAVTLWPVLDPQLTRIAGLSFMLPVLFGFIVDWWIVSGRLQPSAISHLERLSRQYFQPALRALLLFLVTKVLSADLTIYDFGLLFSTGLILLGFAGRFGALLLILLLGWHSSGEPIDFTGMALIFTTSWILLLGTGRFSLWQWGDEWVARYDGA